MDYARNLFKSLVAPKDSITNDEPLSSATTVTHQRYHLDNEKKKKKKKKKKRKEEEEVIKHKHNNENKMDAMKLLARDGAIPQKQNDGNNDSVLSVSVPGADQSDAPSDSNPLNIAITLSPEEEEEYKKISECGIFDEKTLEQIRNTALSTKQKFPNGSQFRTLKDAHDAVSDFANKFYNGYNVRRQGRNKILCSRSSNTNHQKVTGAVTRCGKKSSSMVTNCPFSIILSQSRTKDGESFFTIKHSICLHNHECNDNNYIQTMKKSGKYTKDVVDHVIPILAPYIRNGEKPTTSFVRDLISPLLPQRFAIDAQFVCNIMALAKNKMKSEHFEDPRPLNLDSESIDSLPGLDKASASARATLDEVQRTCNDTSWDVYVYMKKLQSKDDGFKYDFMSNEKDQVIGVTWQTTSMRSALMKFGEIVNFDFRKARSNNLSK